MVIMASYCPKCGNAVKVNQTVCLQCGTSLHSEVDTNEKSETLVWGVLGFLVPIAGLVLYLAWKENKPKSAKSAGIGGLVGFLIGLIYIAAMMIATIPEIGNLF
jgi:predicted nucleic acid-binding Zn ribbon protein